MNFRSFRFLAPKKSNFTEIFILKNYVLKTFNELYFSPNFKSLARREVFLKNSRKSPIQLTLWNQRPAIKLPIGVHYHILIDICCVDTDFGSTHQKSHICGQRFVFKKIKSLVKNLFENFLNAIQWTKFTFLLYVCFKRLAGGPNGTHT